jgi:hypothetical protein
MSALPIMLKQNSASVGLFTLLRERELGIPKPNSWYALAVASFAQEVGRGARKASLTQCLGVCQTVRGSPKATSTNPVGESWLAKMLVLASGNNLVDAPMGNPQPSLTPLPCLLWVGGEREEGSETVRHAAQAEYTVQPPGKLGIRVY